MLRLLKKIWIPLLVLAVSAGALIIALHLNSRSGAAHHAAVSDRLARQHLDHAPFFTAKIATPQDATIKCLECHKEAAGVMKTAHWEWLGKEVKIPGHDKPMRIGKKNLINNYCISAIGNWASCTKCHAGYGWKDDTFDFNKKESVDCLVCHEWSGAYVKGPAGIPDKGIDLAAVAGSVGYPKRENCGVCHNYGGGGQGVKHGDLDSSLDNPSKETDVHMGGAGMLCIDCHSGAGKPDGHDDFPKVLGKSECKECHSIGKHNIRGRAFSVSVEDSNGVSCTGCHKDMAHDDPRIDAHQKSVACQSCHIPDYARIIPTKMFWDWSKAGDKSRSENPHKYLKMKGEFVYESDITPEYAWFNMTMDRYLAGDKLDPSKVLDINKPRGDIKDPNARIWPFKVHRAMQPYDKKFNHLLFPVTGGEGGYWQEYDWDKAFRLGARASTIPYSGEYGFMETKMYWPLSHMVVPAEKAVSCGECHQSGKRMDWKALGYDGDPMENGGRF